MRFLVTLFWVFLLIHMAAYVGSSMIGATYEFTNASIVAVIFTIIVFVVSTILPNDPVEESHQH